MTAIWLFYSTINQVCNATSYFIFSVVVIILYLLILSLYIPFQKIDPSSFGHIAKVYQTLSQQSPVADTNQLPVIMYATKGDLPAVKKVISIYLSLPISVQIRISYFT